MILAPLLLAVAAAAPVPSLTVFGRNADLTAPVAGRVVSVFGNVRVGSRVGGDVIVWGGDVSFAPGGEIVGNLSVFGGEIRGAQGRPLPVRGTVSTPGALLRLYLEEMHRAPWEAPARLTAFTGLRLIALSAWLAISLLLLRLFGSPFARAAASAQRDWTGSLLSGALGVLSLFLGAAAALALFPAFLAIPLAVTAAAVGVAAKIFGMGALFLMLGQKLTRDVAPSRRPGALASGFAVLALFSLLPFVGAILWSAASVAAVGIAFSSRFGTPRYRVEVA